MIRVDLYTKRPQWQETLRAAWPEIALKQPPDTKHVPDIVKVDDKDQHLILVDTDVVEPFGLANFLKVALRADPDVILVGELRSGTPVPHASLLEIKKLLRNLHLFHVVTLMLTDEQLKSLPPFAPATTHLRLALRDAREYLNPLRAGDARGSATDRSAVRASYRDRIALVASDSWSVQALARLDAALDTYDGLAGHQQRFLQEQLTQTIDDLPQRLDAHVDRALTPNHEAKQQLLNELETVACPYTQPYG